MALFDQYRKLFVAKLPSKRLLNHLSLRATRRMLKKVVKYRSSWILHDENIENVQHISLAPEVQQELGCLVGKHVFLEYPWAYVSRETVLKFANVTGSSLEPYRDKIETYNSDTFLVGYSSTQLIARDFVICLTEDAKSMIVKRNIDISKRIRSEIIQKIRKTGRSWKSLGSEVELDVSLIRNTREFFEMQVCFPIKSLGLNRSLCNRIFSEKSWDSYVELIPYERFENIEKKCISRIIQTHFGPREIQVQTYPGYPKNAWTQYIYEDTLGLDADNDEFEEKEKESVEEKLEEFEEKRESEESKEMSDVKAEKELMEKKNVLALFLKDHAQVMIDAVCYNTVVNVHVDDIEALTRQELEITQLRDKITYVERFSLVDLRLTMGKVISDVSWHPCLIDYVAISYVPLRKKIMQFSSDIEYNFVSKTDPTVLLWSLTDSLQPRLLLQCDQDIQCISFCPTNGDFVIGGSISGQIVIWNIHEPIENQTTIKLEFCIQDVVPVAAVSDRNHSHELPIRQIQWVPDNYRIEPSGKLTKLSTCSSCQFMTISEDGIVAIWDLLRYSIIFQLKPSDYKDLGDELFRPTYRLNVRPYNDSIFTPLYLYFPSISVFQEGDKQHNELNITDKDNTKRFWIGTAQGHFACCTWESQFDIETSGVNECKLLDCTSAHDGPVASILRSPHFSDILLTIGGHVFAIWKDDYLNFPVFRRKSNCVYTACCWSNRPGTFLMGTSLGDLEVWDIEKKANKPVLTQTISREPIILLSLQGLCKQDFKLIGVGDCNSAFRIFEEPAEIKDDILEKVDWFEEYVWREVRRKKMFSAWQNDFLQNDVTIVARRQARADEERRLKLEMTRLKLHKEHEERLRLEAEEKVRKVPKSKDVMWKLYQQGRMKKVLLEKKKFVPQELEEKRLPLIRLTEERNLKMNKGRNEVTFRDKYFNDFLSLEFPDYDHDLEKRGQNLTQRHEMVENEKIINIYLQEFYKIRDETRRIIAEKPVSKFAWNTCIKKGKKRL
ncbi:dynein axonemal intermediate chain 3 [Anoplolepis gracilipes]|uniref:dynein axonemal intermediate chain 3 n=1 Tax=Anoplolepis gracilipes TaxID=354296 RepID=UPI003BA1F9E3